MVEKKLLFIYNPKAGKGQIRTHLSDILEIFTEAGYETTVRPTCYAKEAVEIAYHMVAEYGTVVCSGGDGTLDEVVTGIMKSGWQGTVGYIPAGSTNDFANSLGLPKNMKKAARAVVGGDPFLCDVGAFNGDTFVYIAAFGLFTEVSYETRQEMKNVLGHTAYLLEGVKKLGTVKSYRMKVVAQDMIIEDEFLYGMITNSKSVGGFKGITGKHVDLSDGLFEVTLIKRPRNLDQLNRILGALTVRDIDTAHLYSFKTACLRMEFEEETAWTLDGEFGGRHKDVRLENRKQAIRIMVPGKNG